MPTLFQTFGHNCKVRGDRFAFTFLEDGENRANGLTYSGLFERSTAIAQALLENDTYQKPVLLLYPPGLEYITAFMACLAAGAIAVPIYPPRNSKHADRLNHILKDSGAQVILTTALSKEKLLSFDNSILSGCKVYTTAELGSLGARNLDELQIEDNVAFIQYTSGSTGNPKGVIVTNRNLAANQEQIRGAIHQGSDSVIVSWLPMYHDMGLIGNILHNLYIGSHCVLFPPLSFLQRPIRWLQAISCYKATLSGAPNFAFDLLNDLDISEEEDFDLSSLQILFNGSEKVRNDTLSRFIEKFEPHGLSRNVIYPCYGLAEATLMVSGNDRGVSFSSLRVDEVQLAEGKLCAAAKGQVELVGAGPIRPGMTVKLLAEQSLINEEGIVGEICVSGDNVTQGYWGGKGRENFLTVDEQRFLKTGDLGAFLQGELYITGRKKEIVIRNGVNYYPYDIERVATESHTDLTTNGCAAFSVDDGIRERLVLIAEINRSAFRSFDPKEIFKKVNQALTEEFTFQADDIVLIKPMRLPKTSSGKIRRSQCREGYLSESFEVLASMGREMPADLPAARPASYPPGESGDDSSLLRFMLQVAGGLTGKPVDAGLEDDFSLIGLDSLKLIQFASELEKHTGARPEVNELFEQHTFRSFIQTLRRSPGTSKSQAEGMVSSNQKALWMGAQNDLNRNYIGFCFMVDGGDDHADKLKSTLAEALAGLGYEGKKFVLSEGELVRQPSHSLFYTFKYGPDTKASEVFHRHFEGLEGQESENHIRLLIHENRQTKQTNVGLVANHMVSDGWSLAVLFEHWLELLDGKSPQLKAVSAQKFVQDELRALENDALRRQAESAYSEAVCQHGLNELLSNVRMSQQGTTFHKTSLNKEDLYKAAAKLEATPNQVLLGCYQLALQFLTSSPRICTVSPVSRRNAANRSHMFGYLVNLIYLTSSPISGQTVKSYFGRLRHQYRTALKYQEIPYSHLLRNANLSTDELKALGLFYYAYQGFDAHEHFGKLFENPGNPIKVLADGTSISSAEQVSVRGNFSMEMEVFELECDIAIVLKYDTSVFTAQFAEALLESVCEMARQLTTAHSQSPVKSLVPPPSQAAIIEGTPKPLEDQHFLSQFRKSVDSYPGRIAVAQNEFRMSYEELDQASDWVATNLRTQYGIGQHTRVALEASRNPHEIAAIIGIMKAGAVYVPIDMGLPPARKLKLLQQSKIRHFVTASRQSQKLAEGIAEISLPALFEEAASQSYPLSESAYVIHTSGTTSQPKAVLVSQRALANLNETMIAAYKLVPEDCVLQFAPLSFDMSVEEIFPILCAGGMIAMREESTIDREDSFYSFCENHSVSILNLPTAYWAEIIESDKLPSQVRLVSAGGEKMRTSQVKKWRERFGEFPLLFNAYGPTEYTVNACIKQIIGAEVGEVSVGKPVHNTRVSVQNAFGLPLPEEVVGEIVLEGQGLADYLDDPDNSRFRSVDVGGVAIRQYLTGDLGYCTPGGEIVVTGRKDNQSKVRGYRIELEEVVESLNALEPVRESATMVIDGVLYAFVVGDGCEDYPFESELARTLPHYMVPAKTIPLASIPVNSRGKTDEKQLRALVLQGGRISVEPPQNELEEQLASIWKEVLGDVAFGRNTDFFSIGGHSIKAIKLLSLIEKRRGRKLELKTFYQVPTIKALGEYLAAVDWVGTEADFHQDEITI